MATLPGLESIPLQAPRGETPIASYQPGMVQEAQEQEGASVARFGGDVTQGADQIADAQDRIAMSAAMDNFLGAKINADQAATTDQDYATLPQRYHAQLQQAGQQAASGITNPALRSEFQSRVDEMSNWSADRVIGEAHAKAINADRASLDQFTQGVADKYAAATDDPTRAALLQNGQDAINAMAAKGSITEPERQDQSKFLASTVTTSRAKALVLTNPAQAAGILAPSGQTATGDPIFSQTGTWVDHLPPGQRAQLYDAAVHSVQANQQAAEIDAERRDRLQDKADTDAGEKAADGYIKQLTIDPTKVDPIAIAKDQSIPASQWRTREALISMAQAANGQDADKVTKTYGPGFYAAYQAVHAPDDDPNKITDPQQLYSRVGPNGDLTVEGVDKLRSDLAAKGTPDGVAAGKIQAGALAYAKHQLSFAQDYGTVKIPDPKGEDAFNIAFTPAFFKYWDDGIAAGKSPQELASKSAIDGIVASVNPRSPAEMARDRIDADAGLPADAGSVPGKATAPQLDLVPPAGNTRVAGQTIVHTAKFPQGVVWQADGKWHPLAPPAPAAPAAPPPN